MWRVLLLPFLFGTMKTGADPEPIVRTKFGLLRGKWMTTNGTTSRDIEAFLGIPYAESPVEDRRFKSPTPWTSKWIGKRNATEDGPMCMQLDSSNNTIGAEDCLYLNVFRPKMSDGGANAKKLPILVFVHGGGFKTGSSDSNLYGPEYLLNKDIILVTLNYRLGFLGFMSTRDENAPGNNGLKDIIAALQWVQDNAESFGGNPESVTLDGHGAGAAAVHLLVLSDRSEGLFHRYVMQSGSGQAPWAFRTPESNRDATLLIAARLNCTADDNRTDEIVDCLKRLDANVIVEDSFWEQISPTVEPESSDAVLTDYPKRRMEEDKMLNLPHIIGVVEDEGLLHTLNDSLHGNKSEGTSNKIERFISVYADVVNNFTAFVERLSSFYFDENSTQKINHNLTQLVGDALVIWPVYETLLYHSKGANESFTYFYHLGFEGGFCSTMKYADGCLGTIKGKGTKYETLKITRVSHMDDINYIFPYFNHLYPNATGRPEPDDTTMINILTEMWTYFAIKGAPMAIDMPTWDCYEVNKGFMVFQNDTLDGTAMEYNFLPERMAFWRELMENFSLPMAENYTPDSGISISPSPFVFSALLMYICM